MTLSVNGGVKSGAATLGSIIGDAVMSSMNANKASALLTVKNYSIESDAQVNQINQQVEDGYKTQKDNEEEAKKAHRHKLMHKIFGAIFHIVRAVVHIAQPRKMIKSVSKLMHPKRAVKSMTKKLKSAGSKVMHPKTAKSLFRKEAKNAAKEVKNVAKEVSHTSTAKQVLKFANKTANWGQAGLAVYDGVGKVQISNIKKDLAEIRLAKSLSENIYSCLESEKKQQMQTVSDRVSDVISTEKSVNEMINTKGSMQAQLVSSI